MTASQAQDPESMANSRICKAPREAIFALLTDAEPISKW